MLTINKRLITIGIGIIFLLLIPFVAMQFTNEVNWSVMDFVIAGGLLVFFGLVIEFVLQKVKKPNNRSTLVFALVVLLLLIWVELAVGIFGTPFSGS